MPVRRFFNRALWQVLFVLAAACSLNTRLNADEVPGVAFPIRYRLAKPGHVSINLYDEKGAIVRELLRVTHRAAGDQLEIWDGLDSRGKPLPPAKYSWKLLSTPGLKAEYLMKVGTSYTLKPDADWWQQAPGDITGPGCVFCDESGIYLSAASENIGPGLIKQSRDGSKRLWERRLPSAYVIARGMARVGDTLWVFSGNDKYLLPLNANTGEDAGKTISTAWDNESGEYMSLCESLLTVCYPKKNAVRWYDPATGEVALTTEINNPVAVAGSGKALYISNGTAVFRATQETSQPIQLIEGLQLANLLAVDTTNGDLLVYEGDRNGAGNNQVKRYSRDGKLLRSYGQAGGRKHGLYTRQEQQSFSGVFGMAATPDGGFAICEPWMPPRRATVFNKDGELQHEWYGAQMWAPVTFPEPDNPNAVWMTSDWNGFMRCLLDTKTKTWTVHSTYRWDSMPLSGGTDIGEGFAGAFLHDGELYLQREGRIDITRVDRQNWKLVPVTVQWARLQERYGDHPHLLSVKMKEYIQPHHLKNLWLSNMWWTDENGDGQPQPTEIQWRQQTGISDKVWTDKNGDGQIQPDEEIQNGKPSIGYWTFMDDDFNIHWLGDDFRAYSLPVVSWNAVGAPLYGHSSGPTAPTAPEFVRAMKGPHFPTRDAKTGDYYIAANNFKSWGNSDASYLVKLGPDGNFKWAVGGAGVDPGQIKYFRRNLGVVQGCIAATNTSNEWPSEYLPRTYVWDGDGLYIGGLLDHPVVEPGTPLWHFAAGAEAKNGVVWEDPKTGEVLYFGHGTSEGRIYKITGWDGWERASGKLEIKVPSTESGNGLIASLCKADGTQVGQWTMAQVSFNPTQEFKSQAAQQFAKKERYLVRWTGQIAAPADDKYTFLVRGAGQTRLLIDGRVILDSSLKPEQSTLALNSLEMKADQKHSIQFEYSPIAKPTGGIELLWHTAGQSPTPIPALALFATPNPYETPYGRGIGLVAKYYKGVTELADMSALSQGARKPDIERLEPEVNIDQREHSVVWEGFFEPRNTGWSRLAITTGSAYVMTIKLKDRVAPDHYVYLEAGKRYPIAVYGRSWSDVFNNQFMYQLRVSRWTAPNTTEENMLVVPQSQLHPFALK